MISRLSGIFLFSGIVILLSGCSGTGENSYVKNTSYPLGRELYYSKCTSCHKAYEREMFNPSEWDKIINEMALKARLTAEQKQNMLNYLTEK